MMETLSHMQDEALALAAQAGEPDAAELLCERYKDTVRAITRPYFLLGGDRDDLLQEGMIGLYKAIQHYKGGHNAAFHSFAELCVTRQIMSAIKMAARNKHQPLNTYVSLYGPSGSFLEDGPDLLDVLKLTTENPEDTLLHKEAERDMRRKLDELLSPFEKQVVDLFLAGLSYQQIAARLSCGRKSVDNALQRVKKKLDI
ncbi:MAG: RNA polymerase sporulation sigma factor SigH [Candidatus Pelethousia sp.]|nr:RNA polymerase sporulation sigma factor SigH [Candidatus Pelethousia sp.]